MNPVIQAILERRSVRKFKPEVPSRELIDQVVEAGLYAASGHFTQGVKTIVITNKEVRDAFSAINAKIWGKKEGFDPFFGAPVVLLVLADGNDHNAIKNGSLVMGNMMLAAHALGLGSCWINRADGQIASEYGQEFLKKLGIEPNWIGVGNCILGYSAQPALKAAKRKPDRVYYVE